MTKIALLLCGQLRTVDLVKYIHFHHLISHYETDVFLSIDLNNSLQCENKNSKNDTSLEKATEVIDFFKPVDFFILNHFDEEWNNLKNRNQPFELDYEKLLFEQYFVVSKAYSLLNNYKSKTNKKYDIIIRLRFDQFIWTEETNIFDKLIMNNNQILFNNENIQTVMNLPPSPSCKINFNAVNDKSIYLLGFEDFKHYKYANDQFWYHNESILEIMSNFYENIYNISITCNKNNIGQQGAKIECIFYQYLTSLNINMEKTNICGIFVREFY